MKERKEPPLPEKALLIIGKYFDSIQDFKYLTETCKEYEQIVDLYRENPVPVHNDRERAIFPNAETYRANSSQDLRMILKSENKPHAIKMDYAEPIYKKSMIESEVERKGIELRGNYKSPIRLFMDSEVTELESGPENYDLIDLSETGITVISQNFFFGKLLTEIRLPLTLTSICSSAFEMCVRLRKITLPDSILTIGDRAFKSCSHLEDIKIPNNLKRIEYGTFEDCFSLKTIVIPIHVSVIEYNAFYKCKGLEYISIPTSVTSLGESVLGECTSLETVDFCPNIKKLPLNTFRRCESLIRIKIPTTITKLGKSCFEFCTQLRQIYGLENIKEVEDGCIHGCNSLYRDIITALQQLNSAANTVRVPAPVPAPQVVMWNVPQDRPNTNWIPLVLRRQQQPRSPGTWWN